MTIQEKELIISRIIAGCFKVDIYINDNEKKTFLVKQPNRVQRYLAEEVYQETLESAGYNGSYTQRELIDFLISKNLWDEIKQKTLDDSAKKIEDLKVELYESLFRSGHRKNVRRALNIVRAEHTKLFGELHSYDYLTAVGVSQMAKARYLIAASLHRLNDTKLFNEEELWAAPDYIIESVANIISNLKIDESRMREISRTDPWRSIWMARKAEQSLFGIPAVDLTDEQRVISIWSSIYDNIYEHPECPNDEIVNDDDMVDGWMIIQKRKRDSDKQSREGESLITNERIRNSEEIFIPVDTVEDARKVESLNDAAASIVKAKRMKVIQDKGVISETYMPDSQMKIRQQMAEMYKAQLKG